jgi:hypothetical protein
MSIRIMTKVWDSGLLEGSTLLLLLALADSANDEGFCWPSAATLMTKTRLSHATLFRSMKSRIDLGWIEKKSRAGSKAVAYQFLKAVSNRDSNLSQSEKKLSQFEITPTPPYRSNRKEPSEEKRDCVKRVFDYYVKVVGKSNLYDLIDLRMQKGLARLEECLRKTKDDLAGAEEIMRFAVDQISRTEWNMGKNPQKRMYNDWEDQLFGSESRMSKWLEEAIQG